jgi:hypothetical protein
VIFTVTQLQLVSLASAANIFTAVQPELITLFKETWMSLQKLVLSVLAVATTALALPAFAQDGSPNTVDKIASGQPSSEEVASNRDIFRCDICTDNSNSCASYCEENNWGYMGWNPDNNQCCCVSLY